MSMHVSRPSLADYRCVVARRYAGDGYFVYPDIGFLARVLNGSAAYLRRGRARSFAVSDGARCAAFAVAFVDPGLSEKTGSATGSIGFFEAMDPDSAGQVIAECCDWLADEKVTEVWAPFNANSYNGMGTRLDRFGEVPFIGCAHDPGDTKDFLLKSGFTPVQRYLNFAIDLAPWRVGGLARDSRGSPADGKGAAGEGVQLRPVSRLHFREEVLGFVRLHNAAFRNVWGEVEISEAEALQMLMRSRLAIEPKLFQFAVRQGERVGFVWCIPNLTEVIAPLYVPVTSLRGIARLVRRRHAAHTAGLLSLGVKSELHGRGIGSSLVAAACRASADLGYRTLEYALVAESNEASLAMARRFGGVECRSFGIYRRSISSDRPRADRSASQAE